MKYQDYITLKVRYTATPDGPRKYSVQRNYYKVVDLTN